MSSQILRSVSSSDAVDPASIPVWTLANGTRMPAIGLGTFGSDHVSHDVQRLDIAQAFNTLGAICGVLVGTLFIFSGVELSAVDMQKMRALGTYDVYLQHETIRIIAPYLILGVLVLFCALLIARNHFPAFAEEQSLTSALGPNPPLPLCFQANCASMAT